MSETSNKKTDGGINCISPMGIRYVSPFPIRRYRRGNSIQPKHIYATYVHTDDSCLGVIHDFHEYWSSYSKALDRFKELTIYELLDYSDEHKEKIKDLKKKSADELYDLLISKTEEDAEKNVIIKLIDITESVDIEEPVVLIGG